MTSTDRPGASSTSSSAPPEDDLGPDGLGVGWLGLSIAVVVSTALVVLASGTFNQHHLELVQQHLGASLAIAWLSCGFLFLREAELLIRLVLTVAAIGTAVVISLVHIVFPEPTTTLVGPDGLVARAVEPDLAMATVVTITDRSGFLAYDYPSVCSGDSSPVLPRMDWTGTSTLTLTTDDFDTAEVRLEGSDLVVSGSGGFWHIC